MNDWGVVHRVLHDEGEDRILRLRITGVAEGVTQEKIRLMLAAAGRVYGEGNRAWGNHQILPRDEWTDRESDPAETLSYADLQDEAKGEKRVTLRIPIGLHAALVRAARRKSFNQFCCDTLGAAIGSAEESLEAAVPRLAATWSENETETRAKINRMASVSRADPSALRARYAAHLGNVATMTPERLKARQDALLTDPQMQEAFAILPEAIDSLPDSALSQTAAAMGVTVAQLRAKIADAHAEMPEHIATLQTRTPEEAKDTALLLRDVMAGKGVGE